MIQPLREGVYDNTKEVQEKQGYHALRKWTVIPNNQTYLKLVYKTVPHNNILVKRKDG